MSSRSYEYSASVVGGPGCSYSNLNKYNAVNASMSPPVPSSVVSGYYVVPNWNPVLSYDTLVKGSCCSSYPSIVSAYGEGAECCQTPYTKICCQPACPPPCGPRPPLAAPVQKCCGR